MMRIAVAFALTAFLARAQVFDVRAFGACGDGSAKDTQAIQRAVDAAGSAGGGTVELTAGVYLSGTVVLRSHVDFHLGPGAVLLASPDRADYNPADAFPLNWASARDVDNTSGGHLLVGSGIRDVTLRGPGRIDGNSKAFLVDPSTGTNWKDWKRGIPWRPGQMVWFCNCEDIRITDLELADSPYWTCNLFNCERVWVRGCYIHNERRTFKTWNGDGIDIDRCRQVSVSDCRIDTTDDGITLRASMGNRLSDPKDCAFVTVANCILSSSCNAVRLGVGEGGIHDAVFQNLTISRTSCAFDFVGAYGPKERGTDIWGVRIASVRVDADRFLKMDQRFSSASRFEDVVFDGISGKVSKPSQVAANSYGPIRRIRFNRVDLPLGVRVRNADCSVDSCDLTVRDKEELVLFSGIGNSSGTTREFMCDKTSEPKGEK